MSHPSRPSSLLPVHYHTVVGGLQRIELHFTSSILLTTRIAEGPSAFLVMCKSVDEPGHRIRHCNNNNNKRSGSSIGRRAAGWHESSSPRWCRRSLPACSRAMARAHSTRAGGVHTTRAGGVLVRWLLLTVVQGSSVADDGTGGARQRPPLPVGDDGESADSTVKGAREVRTCAGPSGRRDAREPIQSVRSKPASTSSIGTVSTRACCARSRAVSRRAI